MDFDGELNDDVLGSTYITRRWFGDLKIMVFSDLNHYFEKVEDSIE